MKAIISKQALKIIHFFIVCMVSIVSCESKIDLGDDGLGTVLLMNAQLCSSDTDHTVMLACSNQKGVFPVETATITCYINGKLVSQSDTIDSIEEVSVGMDTETNEMFIQSCCLLHFNAQFKPGDFVCIKADSGNLHCESSVTVPSMPSILDVKVTECESDVERELGRYRFEIQVEDIPDALNYYSLSLLDRSYVQVVQIDDAEYYKCYGRYPDFNTGDIVNVDSSEIEINNTRDPLFNSDGETIASSINSGSEVDSYLDNKMNLFTDYLFRDKSYTITFYSEDIFIKPQYGKYDFCTFAANNVARVRLLNLNKEEYQYLTGLQFENSAESGTYFTSDYIYPTNVKNGLGFVSINSARDFDVHISTYLWDRDFNRQKID